VVVCGSGVVVSASTSADGLVVVLDVSIVLVVLPDTSGPTVVVLVTSGTSEDFNVVVLAVSISAISLVVVLVLVASESIVEVVAVGGRLVALLLVSTSSAAVPSPEYWGFRQVNG
jgi:hypothetical protein